MGVNARLGRVALFGLGSSTRAVGEWLAGPAAGAAQSVTVFCGDADPAGNANAEALAGLGCAVVPGSSPEAGAFDLGVVSPGIPAVGEFYRAAQAACAELATEPELAWRQSPRDWVAVTGTNGKTTTTTLLTELLRAGGVAARAVGNIGLPPIACVADRAPGEVFAAELSSFQLEGTSAFAPHVAVLLNITADHVEWHGSLEAYAAAKERVFARMGPGDLALVGPDDACRAAAARARARGVRSVVLGEKPAPCALDAAWLDEDGRLAVRLAGRDQVLCPYDDMALAGPHNLLNALAAAAAALEMGADPQGVVRGLRAFEPLAHRVEPCGTVGGVAFIDDSKATNTDAVVKALDSFEAGRVIVLLGGHDKGTDLADLAEATLRACRLAVTYGQAGPRIRAALEAAASGRAHASCAIVSEPGMAAAFAHAAGAARPGDVVLLSPACSSFDEFGSYKERGDAFKALVRDLQAVEAARGSAR